MQIQEIKERLKPISKTQEASSQQEKTPLGKHGSKTELASQMMKAIMEKDFVQIKTLTHELVMSNLKQEQEIAKLRIELWELQKIKEIYESSKEKMMI